MTPNRDIVSAKCPGFVMTWKNGTEKPPVVTDINSAFPALTIEENTVALFLKYQEMMVAVEAIACPFISRLGPKGAFMCDRLETLGTNNNSVYVKAECQRTKIIKLD